MAGTRVLPKSSDVREMQHMPAVQRGKDLNREPQEGKKEKENHSI